MRSRRRTGAVEQEADRLSRAITATLALEVRAGRLALKMTQAALAAEVGVHQGRISQIERGRGQRLPLDRWIAIGVALQRPFAVSFSRPNYADRHVADAGHLKIQELLLALAQHAGRTGSFELPTRPSDPSRSADVVVIDEPNHCLIVQEAWNTFGDLGAAVRSTNRKAVEAEDLTVAIAKRGPLRVAVVWVVRASATNRAVVSRYPHVFATAFPGSSRRWVRALMGTAAPPEERGLVWADPAIGRLFEWRRDNADQ